MCVAKAGECWAEMRKAEVSPREFPQHAPLSWSLYHAPVALFLSETSTRLLGSKSVLQSTPLPLELATQAPSDSTAVVKSAPQAAAPLALAVMPSTTLSVSSATLRDSISSKTPIRFSAAHEPFLPFPPSPSAFRSSLKLTPPRPSDSDALISTLNHPLVYPALRSPPYPYLPHHATAVIESGLATAQALFEQWGRDDWTTPEGCPLNTIRGVLDGEEVWIGALGVRRWPFDELEGDEKAWKVAEMMGLPAGDAGIIWTIGCESFL